MSPEYRIPTHNQYSPTEEARTEPTPPSPAADFTIKGSRREREKYTSPPASDGLIAGSVPPINVLIVEDNIINRKLLVAFMKRLNVRWVCVADGAEAVRNWRRGGFHLVLMNIQLPVMNGLDATREIRRLERLNGIGVFP